MKPGIRVLRGPDWNQGNQDGGLGYLGTVIKLFRDNKVKVRWDIGTETVCRAGANRKYDLRIYDNAQVGVVSAAYCDECSKTGYEENLHGFRWKCLVCHDFDLCTPCYMKDSLDLQHPYVRYTTYRATVARVSPRKRSRRIPLNGIFPGSVVRKTVLTPDTEEEVGTVTELIDLQPDANRSAVKVDWNDEKKLTQRGDLPLYRLGADGKVELTLVTSSSPGHVYIDHLPCLDTTMPVDVSFNPGDIVRIDLNLETFKALQNENGGWVPDMEKCLGEDGKIDSIQDPKGRCVSVTFSTCICRTMYINCLTKVSTIKAGDTVKIIEDVEKVKKCQVGHGGWQDTLISYLGQLGTVLRMEESGNAIVQVSGQTFVFSQACLVWTPVQVDGEGKSLEKDLTMAVSDRSQRRKKFHPDEPVNVGARVVRGPDWSFENQDGGEGYMGSVVELCTTNTSIYPPQCVLVQWDNGEKNVYRAGHTNSYDLRLLDNAGTGVRHNRMCSSCKNTDIPGLMWNCSSCTDMSLCSDCYSADKHDINHTFVRLDYRGDKGTNVPKRSISKKVQMKGVFEKARVSRGPDWRWNNQDGGPGKTGEVIALVNFSPETDHDAVEITWENGYTNVYRLGYKGRLDIKCEKSVIGGFYYRDHLPILKLAAANTPAHKEDKKAVETVEETAAKSSDESDQNARFKEGDRVRIEIEPDLLKMMEQSRGAWNDSMTECIGKTGLVIVSKGQDITVDFEGVGTWTFLEAALSKVKEFVPGEIVKVNRSLDHVRMLQTDRGGWNDQMAVVIGKCGRVEEIDEDGDVQVSFGEYTWTFNPDCLQPDQGQPDTVSYTEDDVTEKTGPPSLESTGDEQFDRLFAAINKGDVDTFNRIIQREPQLMLLTVKGKSAIHLASHCGQIEIVKALFQQVGKESLIEMTDDDDSTPLLTAVKGGQLSMIRYLVDQGANKDATNRSKQCAAHMAVTGQKIEVLMLLRDLTFNINHRDMLEQSAIYDAITSNIEEIVQVVLEWPGLEVTYDDNIGFSPFCCACRKGDLFAAQKILEIAPQELNRRKPDGYTGLHVAVINNNVKLIQFLLQQPNIEKDIRTLDGRTPLLLACLEGLLELAKVLLQAGCDSMAKDTSDKNCLHLLMEPQEEKTVKAGWQDNRIELAMFLIREGVPADTRDKAGQTPLDLMEGSMKTRVTEFLSSRKDQSKPPTSLPVENASNAGQAAEGPMSLPVGADRGNQGQGTGQIQTKKREICKICEEDEATDMAMPCEDVFCLSCIGNKKRVKNCPECGEKIESIMPL